MGRRTRNVERALTGALDALTVCRADVALLDAADRACELVAKVLEAGGRLLVCGNGGSMSDAMHFAEELTGRYRSKRLPLPAMALSDPAAITCIANDFGFDEVFARQVEAHGRDGDLLVALSTSGRSPNVARALAAARARGMSTIALLGADGGVAVSQADVSLIVPVERDAARIQEVHLVLLHALVDSVEERLDLA